MSQYLFLCVSSIIVFIHIQHHVLVQYLASSCIGTNTTRSGLSLFLSQISIVFWQKFSSCFKFRYTNICTQFLDYRSSSFDQGSTKHFHNILNAIYLTPRRSNRNLKDLVNVFINIPQEMSRAYIHTVYNTTKGVINLMAISQDHKKYFVNSNFNGLNSFRSFKGLWDDTMHTNITTF